MANNGGRLAESRCVIEVVVPLLNALHALHAMGIVHRDIKPEHIICSYGSIRLLDFFESAQRALQCLNYRAGQLEYMAPEVANKPRAEDIFHEVRAGAWPGVGHGVGSVAE
jgi:eukaryotic-like serine/threonine-protein kinase